MPDNSPVLALPLIQPAQAQKHITHNEALRILDVIVQLSVKDRDLATAPASPAEGDRYIVAAAPGGAWAGQAGRVAFFADGYWSFLAPLPGWQAWVEDEARVVTYSGTAWQAASSAGTRAELWGVAADPDSTNRLSVNSPAVLFNHAGAGMEATLNKAAAAQDAALAFKQGFSARALMGLLANDDFTLKVSADGASYSNALVVDRTNGALRLAAPVRLEAQSADPAPVTDGQIWLHGPSGQVRVRSAGTSVAIAPGSGGGLTDGDKGDVVVSAGGTEMTLDPSVKYGLHLALSQFAFSN